MDNADLEKLSISPGKLSPKFHANTTEYTVTLGSDVKQLKVDPLTSDSGACYTISGGGKTVDLPEGQVTTVKIEVSAEDGSTIKNYFIHATRLSASDASLTNIKCTSGQLSPQFSASMQTYTISVPFSLSTVELTPVAADKKTVLKLNGNENLKEEIQLNFGETKVDIEVTSPDKSNTKVYTVVVCKEQFLRPVCFVDQQGSTKNKCPVCLGVLYRPKSIADSKYAHVFCKSCIDELTRTSKQDPLDDTPLVGEWRVDEFDLEKSQSSLQVHCVFSYWGCNEKPKLCDLGCHAIQCEYRPVVIEKSSAMVSAKDAETKAKDCSTPCSDCNRPIRPNEMDTHKSYMCTSKVTSTAAKHKVEVRAWEKKLHQETSEKSANKLVTTAQGLVKDYLNSLPKHGCAGQYTGEISPLIHLDSAAEWYATAIKLSPKDATLHFGLAQVFEEQYYAQDLYGLKPQRSSEVDLDFNIKSKDSSKEDDIQALCEMRGVGRNAPLSMQLKAIDEEYHYLVEQGRSDKAEYVQQLYAFKSKQALKADKTAELANNEEEPLGKAYIKYMDALTCGADNYLYSLHVGRMLILQGRHDEAVTRLNIAVGLKPTSIASRFSLGLALAQQTSGPGKRKDEAICYISEGLEYLLNDVLNQNASKEVELTSSTLMKHLSVQCLQGFLVLADQVKNVTPPPVGVMSASTCYHCTALLSTRALSSLVARGDTYHAVEWILFQAHSSLLQLALEAAEKESKPLEQSLVASWCDNLSALIKNSTIPPGKQLLELQEKTCQQGVMLQPTSSRSLYLLGDAQLRYYDNDPNSKDVLQEAENSYRVSMELEGQPSGGKAVPEKIREQKWYKDREAKRVAEKKAKEVATTPQKAGTGPAKAGATAGRGASPTRGGVAPRGAAAAGRGRGTASTGRGTASAKAPATKPAARGKASPARGASTTSRTGTNKPSVSPTKSSCSHKAGSCAPAPTKSQPKLTTKSQPKPATPAAQKQQVNNNQSEAVVEKPVGPPNKPVYQPRLGLARVLVRNGATMEEIQELYEDVISMAPEIHDAYIELADSLVKAEPMKAVDIYCRYPFKEDLNFDDAYIHGEIVRLIMKQEKYDDPRLGPSLIALGKVMGLTVIEKYVEALDKTFKYSKLLCQVYAGVHGKEVDDSDLQQFFKFKCWI